MSVTESPPVLTGMEKAVLALAAEIGRLADSMDGLAAASQAMQVARQAPVAPNPSGPAMPPVGGTTAPPAAGGEREKKMGSKVYAICTQNGWDLQAVGETITGHPMAKDSRKWSFADLGKVLDQFAEWGFG